MSPASTGRSCQAIAVALCLATGVSSAQQAQAPVFRGGTPVVPLTVTVIDRNGAAVTDLKQADFTVLENGKPREILNFFTQTFADQPGKSAGVVNRATLRKD